VSRNEYYERALKAIRDVRTSRTLASAARAKGFQVIADAYARLSDSRLRDARLWRGLARGE